MGKFHLTFKYIAKFLELYAPALAFCYLALWFLQYSKPDVFSHYDPMFNFLPNIIDSIICIKSDMFGIEATMGYAYAAASMILVSYGAIKLENYAFNLKQREEKNERLQMENQAEMLRIARNKAKEEAKRTENLRIFGINNFYCLFQFKLSYFEGTNVMDKNHDFEPLKKQYSKLIVDKLKEKYKKMIFFATDKIYFTSSTFMCFDDVVEDLVKLFTAIQDLNKKRMIKTDLVASFWCSEMNMDLKKVLKILSNINLLNFENKLVVPAKLMKRYKKNPIVKYNFVPMGSSWLEVKDEDGKDMEVELYYMKKII